MKTPYIATVLVCCLAARVQSQSIQADVSARHLPFGEPVSVEALEIGMQSLFEKDEYIEALVHRHELEFPWLGLPVWTLPDRPTWKEEPFNDNTWQVQYQSLVWVAAYGHGFDLTGDTTYLDTMQRLIFDYIEKNPYPQDTSFAPVLMDLDSDFPTRSGWSSMATANRAEVVTYVVKKWLEPRLSEREKKLLGKFQRVHGWYLDKYLRTDRGSTHNHGLMAAFGLLKMVRAFPDLDGAPLWYKHVRKRIHDLVAGMVDPLTGASTEQSAYYHYFAIQYFLELRDLMVALDEPLDFDLDSLLGKMLAFAAVITYPDGTLPAYGDTKHGFNVGRRLRILTRRWGGDNGMVEFALSEGRKGTPLPPITVAKNEGYVVLRPDSQFADRQSWRNQAVIFADFGDTVRVHGHDDAMSFLAYFDGEAVLVDGSGPYTYMPEYRPYVVARSRGNTVVVDGYERIDNAAEILSTYGDEGFIGATGRLEQQGVSTSRTVAWVDPGVIVVVDHAVPEDDWAHLYSLYHHYPPGASLTTRPDGFLVTTSNDLKVRQQTFASTDYSSGVTEPSPDDEPLSAPGWVITGFKQASPAPVARIDVTDTGEVWFATLLYPDSIDIEAEVAHVQNGDVLELRIGERTLTYSLREDRLKVVSPE